MNKIRTLRAKKGLTQSELSSKTGIGRVDLSRYETGVVNIPIKKAKILAQFFDCTLDELFEREEEAAREEGEG